MDDIPVGGAAVGMPLHLHELPEPPAGYDKLTGVEGAKFFAKVQGEADKAGKAAAEAAVVEAETFADAQIEAKGLEGEEAARFKAQMVKKLAKKAKKAASAAIMAEKYGPVLADPAIHAYQMASVLKEHVDPNVTYKAVSEEPLRKGAKALKTIKDNGYKVAERFVDALPGTYKKDRMQDVVDMTMSTLEEALGDGSIGDVSEQEMNAMVIAAMEQLVYQDIESSKRLLSDHGVRHIAGNMRSSLDILDALKDGGGAEVSGKDKLAAMMVMLHHDIGYTAAGVKDAEPGAPLMKMHPDFSRLMVKQNPFWAKAFGEDADRYLNGMATHAHTSTDWEKHPWESAVRLADNTAVFQDEKLPDLLAQDPRAAQIMTKMLLAQKAGGPRRFGESEWDPKEMEQHFNNLQKQLAEIVKGLKYPDDLKAALLKSVEKDISPHSPAFLLGMYGGKKQGYEMVEGEGGKPQMKVKIEATPERQVLESLFGRVGDFQTERLLDDYNVQGDVAEGLKFFDLPDVDMSDGKPQFTTGGDEAGILFEFDRSKLHDSNILTKAFGKDFTESSIRESLLDYARRASQATDDAKRAELREELFDQTQGKLDDDERAALEEHLDADLSKGLKGKETLADPSVLARELMRFPLTKREVAFLEKPGEKEEKEASAAIRVPISKRETQYRGTKEWVEPVYHKCPAIKHCPAVFGSSRPDPRDVDKAPSCEGLIYDRGVIACSTYHSVCPHLRKVLDEHVLCVFDPNSTKMRRRLVRAAWENPDRATAILALLR